MSYLNAILRAQAKHRENERKAERMFKRALSIADDIDADFFEHDESEALDISERLQRHNAAH